MEKMGIVQIIWNSWDKGNNSLIKERKKKKGNITNPDQGSTTRPETQNRAREGKRKEYCSYITWTQLAANEKFKLSANYHHSINQVIYMLPHSQEMLQWLTKNPQQK